MARQARQISSTGIYHIVTRGINKEPIFLEDRDFSHYLTILQDVQETTEVKIYAYCLMDNHVHLLVKENHQYPIWDIMKRINIRFAMWHNYKYKRVGHFFQGRYRSEAVEDDAYFRTVFRYIHRNPLEAGMVNCLEDYGCSSLGLYKSHYSGQEVWLQTDFGGSFWKSYSSMLSFHNKIINDKCLDLEDEPLTDVALMSAIEGLYDVQELLTSSWSVRNKAICHILKKTGVSHRQLARNLCVNSRMIDRAVKKEMTH